MVNAGVPLHEALDALTQYQSDPLSLWVTPDLCKRISHGSRFSVALSKYPKVFPKTYVALVRGSEETGRLAAVLEQVTLWLDRQDKIEKQVKKALTYPVFVIVLAGFLTFCLFKTVIPAILKTVVGLGAELPLPTKILMGILATLEHPIFWLLVVASVAFAAWFLRTPSGYQRFILFCHYTPLLGGILTSSGTSRFAHTLAMLLSSGIDVIRAVSIAAESSGNPLIKADSIRVIRELREGNYLSDILDGRGLYPPLLVDMVKAGDESGQSAELIEHCSKMLEEDTLHRLDVFMNLLEPIILAAVSIGVGSVLVAILLPMSNLIAAL